MKSIFIAILFCVLFNTDVYSIGVKHTLSGFITEAGSSELLMGVNVYVSALQTGTVSNTYGFYSLSLPPGTYEVQFSFIGFEKQKLKIDLSRDLEANISLNPAPLIQGIEVTAESALQEFGNRMSQIVLPVQKVKELPVLLGEKDVFKTLQLLPGVQKGNEGTSGLYIRGGGLDQNLILLDDAVVYNASHLFGFFSVFNSDAVKSIELTKGGFPARYGGRLSSVIEMNMKDGNKKHFAANGSVGLIASRLTLEGPLIKDKSSFLLSVRRTYADALARPFMTLNKGITNLYFYDINAKLNYEYDTKNRLFFSVYTGRDKYQHRAEDERQKSKSGIYWQNLTATLRWNRLINNRLFSNSSLIYSHYDLNIYNTSQNAGYSSFTQSYRSGITDLSTKTDFLYQPSPKHTIRTGLVLTHHSFSPSAYVRTDQEVELVNQRAPKINSVESGLYVEDEIRLGTRTVLCPGFRLSGFITTSKSFILPEPRMTINYQLLPEISAKASFTVMNQSVHLLSNTGTGLPTDLWVPSTDQILPENSHQFALGLTHYRKDPGLKFSLEGYYKTSEHVISYKEGASFLGISDPEEAEKITWENMITSGKGWSYGAELFIEKSTGRLSGWIGYTLSWTKLQFDEINQGKTFFARYDRRHDISIVAVYKVREGFLISANWVYGSGNAISIPRSQYHAYAHDPFAVYSEWFYGTPWQQGDFNDYGGKNDFRMRAYHRLDVNMSFTKNKKRGIRKWELGVYNLYNRQNPYFYFISGSNHKYWVTQRSLFPFIPSLTYSFTFK